MNIKILNDSELNLWGKLFEEVWPNKEMGENYIDWSYRQCSVRVLLVGCVGGELNKPIALGSRGAWDIPLMFRGAKIPCLQFGDTSVHPMARRKQVFSKMNKLYLDNIKGSYDLIFNISVDSAKYGYEKLGWKYLKGLHTCVYLKRNITLARLYFNRKKVQVNIANPEKYIVRTRNIFHQWGDIKFSVQEFIRREEKNFKDNIFVNKNDKFLDWKFKNPTKKYLHIYSKNEYYASFSIKKRGPLVELAIGFIEIGEDKRLFLQKLLNEINRSVKYDIITIIMSDGHPYMEFIKDFFHVRKKNLNFGVKSVEVTPYLESKIFNGDTWAITSFDLDTF